MSEEASREPPVGEAAQRLKSQQRKEQKIKLYGRAHNGPRRRKRSRRKRNTNPNSTGINGSRSRNRWANMHPGHGFPLPSVREVPLPGGTHKGYAYSQLPLVNAQDTAATAAFSVLEGDPANGPKAPAARLDIRRFSDTLFQTSDDDPECLEQLVQDLAKALPTPGNIAEDIRFGSLEAEFVGVANEGHERLHVDQVSSVSSGKAKKRKEEDEADEEGEAREGENAGHQDPSRDARVAHVVKLAEDERARRMKENDASNLKDMLERARRIEWAVRAIEGERERRAQLSFVDTVVSSSGKNGRGQGGNGSVGASHVEGMMLRKGERRVSESDYKEYTEDYKVICPYSSFGCEKECLRSELPAHFQECPARLELEGFEEPGVYNPLNYIVACPFKIVGCDYLCKRSDLPEHLVSCPARVYDHYLSDAEPYEEGLDAYEVICPYSTLGCEFTCPRSAVSEHLASCAFRPKTRHDEEDERARNKVLAIAAAETERARRMSDQNHGKEHGQSTRNRAFINAVLAAVANRNEDLQESQRHKSKQRVEWFVRAAEIEIVRQNLEKRVLLTSARTTSCNGSVISSGEAQRSSVASSLCLEESSDCSENGMATSQVSKCSIEDALEKEKVEAKPQPPHANPFQDHLSRQAEKLNLILHEVLSAYSVKCIKSCQSKQRVVKDVVAKLCKEAKACFSSPVYVHVFGSYATELAVPGFSDLDVVITMTRTKASKKKKVHEHVMNSIDAALKCNILGRSLKRVKWVDTVKVIDRAHIPVVKLSTKGLDVDLTFALPLHGGLQTVAFVRDLKQMYPALTPLTLVLKTFLAKSNLSDPFTGGLSSYALVLMIVASIRKSQEKGREYNLGALLVDFLELFGRDFDPGRDAVVCVEGPVIAVAKRENVPPLGDGGDHGHASFVVFDPISPGNNVARSCFRINAVQKLFADALASFLSVLVRSEAVRNYDGASLLREILLCD